MVTWVASLLGTPNNVLSLDADDFFFFHSDFVCFECTPRSGIANHMTVRTYHTVFHNSYANLFPPKNVWAFPWSILTEA